MQSLHEQINIIVCSTEKEPAPSSSGPKSCIATCWRLKICNDKHFGNKNPKARKKPAPHPNNTLGHWSLHTMHTYIHKHTRTHTCRLVVAPLNNATLNNHHPQWLHNSSVPGWSNVAQLKPAGSRDSEKPDNSHSVIPLLHSTLLPRMQKHLNKNVAWSQECLTTESPQKNREITHAHTSVCSTKKNPPYVCVPHSAPQQLPFNVPNTIRCSVLPPSMLPIMLSTVWIQPKMLCTKKKKESHTHMKICSPSEKKAWQRSCPQQCKERSPSTMAVSSLGSSCWSKSLSLRFWEGAAGR